MECLNSEKFDGDTLMVSFYDMSTSTDKEIGETEENILSKYDFPCNKVNNW